MKGITAAAGGIPVCSVQEKWAERPQVFEGGEGEMQPGFSQQTDGP